MKSLRIVLTGANGQLGKSLQSVVQASFPEVELLAFSKADLDVRQQGALERVMRFYPSCLPTILVNCAAYTAVDLAEEYEDIAYELNSYAPGYLAYSCSLLDMMMIHISTDYVFDGSKVSPYSEDYPINPLSVYGQTKAIGEENVQRFLGLRALILRTSWLYSMIGKNFVTKMLDLSQKQGRICVVRDQIGSPTYAVHLAKAIVHIAQQAVRQGHFPCTIVHYSNRGACSWYDLAREAIRLMGNPDCFVESIPFSSYPTKVRRPAYSVLDLTGLQVHFNIVPPLWQEGLRDMKTELSGNNINYIKLV